MNGIFNPNSIFSRKGKDAEDTVIAALSACDPLCKVRHMRDALTARGRYSEVFLNRYEKFYGDLALFRRSKWERIEVCTSMSPTGNMLLERSKLENYVGEWFAFVDEVIWFARRQDVLDFLREQSYRISRKYPDRHDKEFKLLPLDAFQAKCRVEDFLGAELI
jgi:hypothetical protein